MAPTPGASPRGRVRTAVHSPLRASILVLAGLATLSSSCGKDDALPVDSGIVRGDAPEIEPPAPALRRLTQTQYENAILDLFEADLYVPSNLEPDNEVEGLYSVGASTTSLSSYGVELYEDAAFAIAEQVIEESEVYDSVVSCEPTDSGDEACFEEIFEPLATRAWRRPVTDAELEVLVTLASAIGTDADDFDVGLEYAVAALLQSPYFIYRQEHGEEDPEEPDVRRLTDWELASRMSFLLWNSIPDEELLEAAAAGELRTDAGLETQARRMLAYEHAATGVRNLFTEVFTLYELDELNKDPNVFTHASEDLGSSAKEETLLVLEDIILEDDADFRELFITERTFVDRRLAALYSIPAPQEDGFGAVILDEEDGRRGFLGQGSFLLLQSHPTSSSPTKRGKFVRTKLLCQEIPAPPADVDTSIPEPDTESPTLRERLQVHLEDPTCASCHQLTDLVGLGFENFDGMGQWRDTENGATIDASGTLDNADFGNAWDMGQVIAEHGNLGPCFTEHVYRYSTGRLVGDGEEELVDWLALGFEQNTYSFQELLVETILSDGFRTAGGLE